MNAKRRGALPLLPPEVLPVELAPPEPDDALLEVADALLDVEEDPLDVEEVPPVVEAAPLEVAPPEEVLPELPAPEVLELPLEAPSQRWLAG